MATVRIPDDLWAAVQALAITHRRSATAELAILVEWAITEANSITKLTPLDKEEDQ